MPQGSSAVRPTNGLYLYLFGISFPFRATNFLFQQFQSIR